MTSDNKAIRLLVAGDLCPWERLQEQIDLGRFDKLFLSVKRVAEVHDAFWVNLETVIRLQSDEPIRKIGAHLFTNEKVIGALKWMGVSTVTLANNHFMDYGQSAAERTQDLLSKASISYVGAGKNLSDAQQPLMLTIKGQRIAIINSCEHEFSVAGDKQFGCNPIDSIALHYQIKLAKKKADYVICIMHGGIEHYQLPSPRMKQLYRFLIDSGASAVINHHQHCFSGYEVYNGKPIFYGLGNFCFDSASDNDLRHKTWNYGYLVSLCLNAGKISFKLIPYEQCWQYPGTFIYKNENDNTRFLSEINTLNSIISNDELLADDFRRMSLSRRNSVYSGLRPYSSRIMNYLYVHGLMPSFLSPKRLSIIKANLDCESHHDILMYNLSIDDLSSKPKL